MVEPLRHRQTKGAETDMPGLPLPRHIPTLPFSEIMYGLNAGAENKKLIRSLNAFCNQSYMIFPLCIDLVWEHRH